MAGVDTWLVHKTRGKVGFAKFFGLDTLLLTTIGRKTGEPRQVPLAFARRGRDFIVIASNFGQAHHPAWSANLIANPEATVELAGRKVTVRARLITGAERSELWAHLAEIWPAYDSYDERTDRDIRVFLLEAHG